MNLRIYHYALHVNYYKIPIYLRDIETKLETTPQMHQLNKPVEM